VQPANASVKSAQFHLSCVAILAMVTLFIVIQLQMLSCRAITRTIPSLNTWQQYAPYMLQNLILDIGNVICNWNPDGLVGQTFDDPADQAEALRVTVNTPDWLALDRGDLSLEDAIARAQARTHLNADDVASVYHNLCSSLTALPSSMQAMARAHEQNVPMYILSNMQEHAWQHLEKTYKCFSWCSGVVVSCRARLIKPDPAIYQYVCDQFSLTPESCVFIDDMKENTEAAIAFGMQSIQLTDKHRGGEVIDGVVEQIVLNRN